MRIDMRQPLVRQVTRATTVAVGLVLGSLAAPAFAAPPTDWEETTNESALHYLLLLVGIPAVIAAVIILLVYLPSMTKRGSTDPALAFHKDSEWFGGPRKGLEETDADKQDADSTGGAGARW